MEYKLNNRLTFEGPELTDQSPMPFGKYKGRLMQYVEPGYLLWLWDNGVHEQPQKAIHKYIKTSWKALLQECPDYISENPPMRD